MTVWVKEVPGVLTAEQLVPLLNADVELKIFQESEDIKYNDVVIVSDRDKEGQELPCNVIAYENVVHDIATSIYREIDCKRNYYYLLNAISKARLPFIDTVITGSSYGLHGIDENMLTHEVNTSLPSQDLYYSLKTVYKLWKDNPNIKNVVLCYGYYIFYSDLSMAQNSLEQQRISIVYEPIFNDVHNAVLLPPNPSVLPQSRIFDVQKCADAFIGAESVKPYFGKNNPRSQYAVRLWQDSSKDWAQLNEEEKEEAGKNRAIRHNGSIKHVNTLRENIILFREFVTFCMQKQIQMLMVVTPASKYYGMYLDPLYKETYYDVLNEMEGTINLLDLFTDESFYDEDFLDMDHLNAKGAKKMTYMILETLRKMS